VRWRPAAAAAAGVVAAIGLTSHRAGAEPVDNAAAEPSSTTTTPDRVSQAAHDEISRVGDAIAASPNPPEGDGPVHPTVKPLALTEIVESALPPVDVNADVAIAPVRGAVAKVIAALPTPNRIVPAPITPRRVPAVTVPIPAAPPPAPAGAPAGKTPSPGPTPSATATIVNAPTPPATPPTSVAPVAAGDQWYPTEVADLADQRIAQRMRSSPVRGPPPTTASALGNDSRNTTTQVAVVWGPSGCSVAISSQSQDATVHNVGIATADAHDGGSATATGNTADTAVTQVSVVVQRGTGTATVEQDAHVDNVGVASATSAGAANATAVGNDSSTNVTQIAVVFIEGSGDAHVTQSTDVDNVGVASAAATDMNASATGNTSTTDVTQIAVVHVHDDDVNVGQSSSTSNIGVASATGGTALGNTATNTTTQVVSLHR
jgi:hypothetical protein